jgi:hypothetical protein
VLHVNAFETHSALTTNIENATMACPFSMAVAVVNVGTVQSGNTVMQWL